MKKLIFFLFFLLPALSFSQKEDYVWMMGYGDGTDSLFTTFTMDFNFDPPVLERRFQDFSMWLTNTSICNLSGDLSLYTNGVDLKNSFDDVITNGEGFQASSSYPLGFNINQGGLILPIPNGNQKIFFLADAFIFTNPNNGSLEVGSNPLTYSIVEEIGVASPFEVIIKKEILLSDTLQAGQITATKHGNGRDWWVLGQGFDNNEYYNILVSGVGVQSINSQIIGDSVTSGISQTAFSPDGNWYAKNVNFGTVNGSVLNTFNQINIYSFDRCEGLLGNHLHEIISTGDFRIGMAFSENSQFLYTCTADTIFQFDMTANNILESRQLVAVYDGFIQEYDGIELTVRFNKMQLAPNGKIYISTPANTRFFHVIETPNELGINCNVTQHSIELPAFTNRSLPNLPNFRLKAEVGSPCDTLRPIAQFSHLPDVLEVTFTDESQRTPTAWQWTFGDGNISELQNPIHEYNQTGSYEVCLIVSNEAGSDTTCQMIEIIIDSLDDLFLGQKVRINPNPSHGEFTIQFEYPTEENLDLEFYDLNGRLLFTDQLNVGEFNYTFKDLSLESGMYILKLKSAVGNVLTRKVVVN